jgi:hypothetical protein
VNCRANKLTVRLLYKRDQVGHEKGLDDELRSLTGIQQTKMKNMGKQALPANSPTEVTTIRQAKMKKSENPAAPRVWPAPHGMPSHARRGLRAWHPKTDPKCERAGSGGMAEALVIAQGIDNSTERWFGRLWRSGFTGFYNRSIVKPRF